MKQSKKFSFYFLHEIDCKSGHTTGEKNIYMLVKEVEIFSEHIHITY